MLKLFFQIFDCPGSWGGGFGNVNVKRVSLICELS